MSVSGPQLSVSGAEGREAADDGITEAALHRAFAQGGFTRARRGAGKGSGEGERAVSLPAYLAYLAPLGDARYAIFAHSGGVDQPPLRIEVGKP
jgi:hypothetical protein